ncbi:hypothetical protein C2S51_012428 [Perilla frutescens var. frutescens]|nr:hypothetical protein C2S51_012428 [Perilla frutescens var. frutescens]
MCINFNSRSSSEHGELAEIPLSTDSKHFREFLVLVLFCCYMLVILSSGQIKVCLADWWLVRVENDVQGRRLAVAGLTNRLPSGKQAIRFFTSGPILKRYDVFSLETTDGICIILDGFINKSRTLENGFPSDVFDYFVFGFPPCWKEYDEKFVGEEPLSKDISRNNLLDQLSQQLGLHRTRKCRMLRYLPCYLVVCYSRECVNHGYVIFTRQRKWPKKLLLLPLAKMGQLKMLEEPVCLIPKESPNESPEQAKGAQPHVDSHEKDSESQGKTKAKGRWKSKETKSLTAELPKNEMKSLSGLSCGGSIKVQAADKHDKGVREIKTRSKIQKEKNTAIELPCTPASTKSSRTPAAVDNQRGYVITRKNILLEKSKALEMDTRRKLALVSKGTPEHEKEKVQSVSPQTFSFNRSRSGRLLMPTLEFWRNQRAIYDVDRTITGIDEGMHPQQLRNGTTVKLNGSNSLLCCAVKPVMTWCHGMGDLRPPTHAHTCSFGAFGTITGFALRPAIGLIRGTTSAPNQRVPPPLCTRLRTYTRCLDIEAPVNLSIPARLRNDNIPTLSNVLSCVLRAGYDVGSFDTSAMTDRGQNFHGGRGRERRRGHGRSGCGHGRGRGPNDHHCEHCERTNHTFENCWMKFGKPDWANTVFSDPSSSSYDDMVSVPCAQYDNMIQSITSSSTASSTASPGTIVASTTTGAFVMSHGKSWLLDSGASVHITGTKSLFMTIGGHERDDLYYLDSVTPTSSHALSATVSPCQWHCLLGHSSSASLRAKLPDGSTLLPVLTLVSLSLPAQLMQVYTYRPRREPVPKLAYELTSCSPPESSSPTAFEDPHLPSMIIYLQLYAKVNVLAPLNIPCLIMFLLLD